jgi:hypothetical protein
MALCLPLLALCGCDRAGKLPPIQAVKPDMGMTRPAAADTSVPSADAVFAPADGASSADAAAGRSNKAMTRGEESAAMPMAGQNNDHSAPVAKAKPASGP